jgi:hypothetical protein
MPRGALRVSVTDGTSRQSRAGNPLLLEDTSGTGHVQATVGDPPFEALFIPPPEQCTAGLAAVLSLPPHWHLWSSATPLSGVVITGADRESGRVVRT